MPLGTPQPKPAVTTPTTPQSVMQNGVAPNNKPGLPAADTTQQKPETQTPATAAQPQQQQPQQQQTPDITPDMYDNYSL